MARKTKAQAAAEQDGNTSHATAPQIDLPAGTGTQNEPLQYIPGQRQRSDAKVEAEEPTEDTKRLQRDKARWGFDENTPAALSAEQREIQAEDAE